MAVSQSRVFLRMGLITFIAVEMVMNKHLHLQLIQKQKAEEQVVLDEIAEFEAELAAELVQ